MHDSSYQKMKAFVEQYLAEAGELQLQVIDIGARSVDGGSGYCGLFAREKWSYRGLDVEAGQNVDVVVSDPYSWTALDSESMDVAVSGQVLEHVEFPWLTVSEVARVLKPGGVFCLIVPSAGPEHRYPLDCWRIYPDGIRALAKHAGLEVVEVFTEWGVGQWQDTFAVMQRSRSENSGGSQLPTLVDLGIGEDAYRRALAGRPSDPAYYSHLDLMEMRAGNPTAAAAALRIGVEACPDNAYLRMRLIAVLGSIGLHSAAIDHGKALIGMPPSKQAMRVLDGLVSRLNEQERQYFAECLIGVPMGRLFQQAENAVKEGLFALEAVCWRGLGVQRPEEVDYRVRYGLALCGTADVKAARTALAAALEWQLAEGIVNRTTMVQQFIDLKKARNYLEIGVERGTNFLQIRAPLKVAVDPAFNIPGGVRVATGEHFVETTSDEFFEKHQHLLQGKADVVFIDGLHTHEQALRDVENALRCLADDGVIVMHDCLPTSKAEACKHESEAKSHPEFKSAWTGDVFRAILDLRSQRDDLEVFVVDQDHGVGVVRKKPGRRALNLSRTEVAQMSFNEFFPARRSLLALKDAHEFKSWLAENYH